MQYNVIENYWKAGVLMQQKEVFTIGHSTHSLETFINLLKQHGIQIVVDVRSYPYSKHVPQFNASNLPRALTVAGIKYSFMGQELGGRPKGSQFYDDDGHVLYSQIAKTPAFTQGISQFEDGLEKSRIAIMCSEEDPTVCHRWLLVGRVLREHGVQVKNIRGDGRIQTETAFADGRHSRDGGMQVSLFPEQEVDEWKSIRSVFHKSQPKPSSVP